MSTRNALTIAAILGTATTIAPALSGPAAAEGLRYSSGEPAAERRAQPTSAVRANPAARLRRPAPSASEAGATFDPVWLYAYVQHLVGGKADAPRRTALPRPHQPRLRPTLTATAAPLTPPQGEPNRPAMIEPEKADRTARAAPPPEPLAPAAVPKPAIASPVVTGALATPAPAGVMPEKGPRVQTLDPRQAADDIVKLELASRVYTETHMSGERVFRLTRDWILLERARDAMNDADRSAAEASGFDAAAYVNDTQRIVVVAIAGTQDLRRDFLANDVWKALIRAQAPQQFYLATQYVRSVQRRYVGAGYKIECVGHSLGGGACAYAASEIGIEARVVNPISAGRLDPRGASLVTSYVVDGEIASIVYGARGNGIPGNVVLVDDGRSADTAHQRMRERLGPLVGIAFIIKDMRDAIVDHRVSTALDRIAAEAGISRMH